MYRLSCFTQVPGSNEPPHRVEGEAFEPEESLEFCRKTLNVLANTYRGRGYEILFQDHNTLIVLEESPDGNAKSVFIISQED